MKTNWVGKIDSILYDRDKDCFRVTGECSYPPREPLEIPRESLDELLNEVLNPATLHVDRHEDGRSVFRIVMPVGATITPKHPGPDHFDLMVGTNDVQVHFRLESEDARALADTISRLA